MGYKRKLKKKSLDQELVKENHDLLQYYSHLVEKEVQVTINQSQKKKLRPVAY